jgi:hypothetical protein
VNGKKAAKLQRNSDKVKVKTGVVLVLVQVTPGQASINNKQLNSPKSACVCESKASS